MNAQQSDLDGSAIEIGGPDGAARVAPGRQDRRHRCQQCRPDALPARAHVSSFGGNDRLGVLDFLLCPSVIAQPLQHVRQIDRHASDAERIAFRQHQVADCHQRRDRFVESPLRDQGRGESPLRFGRTGASKVRSGNVERFPPQARGGVALPESLHDVGEDQERVDERLSRSPQVVR